MISHRHIVAVAFVAALGGAAQAQSAQSTNFTAQLGKPTEPEAVAYLKRGNDFWEVGDFEAAIAEWKAGYLVENAGVFQYNIAQGFRKAGNYEKAIWHYEQFLRLRQPTGAVREGVEKLIQEMKDELAKAAASRPPSGPAAVEEDTAKPLAEPDAAATTPSVPSTLAASDEPRSNDEGGGLSGRKKVAIGIAAVGLLSVGLGVHFGMRSTSLEGDADELCPEPRCASWEEANDFLRRAGDNATYANIGFGVGAAAVIGATVLWLTDGGAPQDRRITIAPRVDASAMTLGLSGNF